MEKGSGSFCSNIVSCLNLFQGDVSAEHIRSFKIPGQNVIHGEIIVQVFPGKSGPGKLATLQLYSASNVDPEKFTEEVVVKHGNFVKDSGNQCGTKVKRYEVEFNIEADFGNPGGLVIRNELKHKFFLQYASLQVHNSQMVHFECNSWIYPFRLTKQDRIFFSNTCYLPNQTPVGLREVRREELTRLRGGGNEDKRGEWDDSYDYDCYNDLGYSENGMQLARHVLGGSRAYPYPRRLRTSRPPYNHENGAEGQPGKWLDMELYVPPDEQFSQKKMYEVTTNAIRAARKFVTMMNEESSSQFESFDQIDRLFTSNKLSRSVDEWLVKVLKRGLPDDLFKKVRKVIKEKTVKSPLPQIATGNKFAWLDDDEFGRQMLAGTNPTVISCLQSYPPESKNGVKSSIKPSDIEHNLDGLTISEAMNQWRIFQLDHHDYLMPFLRKINRREGVFAYASRTILFLRDDSTLKPLAIELTLPGSSPNEEISRVFRPACNGTEAALWRLAKVHVAAVDSGYHQLVNHWLQTHAVIEPFIIATRRRLSVMHPVHRLLDPHFKDTIQVNALARRVVINARGILEKTLFSGQFSVEISSFLYKSWRFDEQSLPSDLIKRGMAVYNPNLPENVELLFEDYPYGADGLDIWITIKNWVRQYCLYFYEDDDSLMSDYEIREWWSEIRYMGHGDKSHEIWWSAMTTRADLVETLTTLIWIVSALHAALTLGQYDYAGYPLNRPTKCRKPIPSEGTMEFAEFLQSPDKYFLSMLPEKFGMGLGIALVDVLSRFTGADLCLSQQSSPKWIDDEKIHRMFKQFGDELEEVKKRIIRRNQDSKLKNRRGKANFCYEVLCPETSEVGSSHGILRSGIPNGTFI